MTEPSSVDEFGSGPPIHDPFPEDPEPISWGDVATSERNALADLMQYQPRINIDLFAEEQLVSLLAATDIAHIPDDVIGASTTLRHAKKDCPPRLAIVLVLPP
ncbi:uncharacterized protein N7446_007893 [Penicillium canescens]|uniref:Uncharacterized protein n=1 Tax=Penicillium canescens TaxID=5083 RepID=A0AAD6NE00_PENCN|nr:uncharacterized protein N7446_007893 [Penicillium canescens]KAJ6033815.1 hypothetical protein N7444_011586 [Penicillium canescens]KAJ6056994.1 hypothetical protein N7460_000268 [Penicillium canescens]KAJ6058310.1 hypothetical protein N7446_007893 [Penicillium canescens]